MIRPLTLHDDRPSRSYARGGKIGLFGGASVGKTVLIQRRKGAQWFLNLLWYVLEPLLPPNLSVSAILRGECTREGIP